MIKVDWKRLFESGRLGFSIYETKHVEAGEKLIDARRVLKFQFGKNGNRNLKDAIIIYRLRHDHSRR